MTTLGTLLLRLSIVLESNDKVYSSYRPVQVPGIRKKRIAKIR
jgi:hypothetical protein